MTEEETFLAAITDQPDDDTVRLVYADWLAENGDPDRGEFVRTEIELARTQPTEEADERRRRVLLDRRAELLKRHKAAWLAPFLPYARDTSFSRGFVDSLEVPANTFLHHAERWFAITPLTRVKITAVHVWDRTTGHTWWASELFASPLLSRLAVLDLEGLRLPAEDVRRLAAHPDLSRLRELVLADNNLRTDGAAILANMPQLERLEALDLRANGITDPGARAVALSPYLNSLKELRISKNSIHNRAWALLENRFGSALVG